MNQSNECNRSQPFLSALRDAGASQQAELGVLSPWPHCRDRPRVTHRLCKLGRAALARSAENLDPNCWLWHGPKQGKKTLLK